MPYAIKYRAEYSQANGNRITLEISKRDYVGSIIAINAIGSPAAIKYRKSEKEAIAGSELSFSFITQDRTTFDDLFVGNYKDFKVLLSINNAAEWQGWIVPDNITADLFNYTYEIALSFNDGLAELDRYRYTAANGGYPSGEYSLLEYIKNCLKFNEIQLDFATKLNYRSVDRIFNGENGLQKATLNSERFSSIKDSRRRMHDCKTIINQILQPFSCVIFQAQNKYWIVNEAEADTNIYTNTYSTLALAGTTTAAAVDITNRKFGQSRTLTKQRPLKVCEVKYENINKPVTLLTSAVSYWNVNNAASSLTNEQQFLVHSTTQYGVEVYSDPVSIDKNTDNDTIDVSFEFLLTVPAGGIDMKISLQAPDGTVQSEYLFDSPTNAYRSFKHTFANKGAGNYVLKIVDIQNVYANITYKLSAIELIPRTSADSVYDRISVATNTGTTAIDLEEHSIKVGSGIQTTDLGNLKTAGGQCLRWSTFGRSEELHLQELYAVQKLRLKQAFLNKVKATIIADDFALIEPHKQLIFNGKRYNIQEYTLRYATSFNEYILGLVEHLGTNVVYTIEQFTADSRNGEE